MLTRYNTDMRVRFMLRYAHTRRLMRYAACRYDGARCRLYTARADVA